MCGVATEGISIGLCFYSEHCTDLYLQGYCSEAKVGGVWMVDIFFAVDVLSES